MLVKEWAITRVLIDLEWPSTQSLSGKFGIKNMRICGRTISARPIRVLMLILAFVTFASVAAAETRFQSDILSAEFLTVETGIEPGAASVSALLHIDLEDGWKTYWRSPGEVGYPMSIDWDGSANLGKAEILWPVPSRFTAFDIENYGYSDEVTFPIQIMLAEPGERVSVVANVSLLTCKEICVPQDFEIRTDLPLSSGMNPDAAEKISDTINLIPNPPESVGFANIRHHISEDQFILRLTSAAPLTSNLMAFPDTGTSAAYGPPKVRIGPDGKSADVSLPILAAREMPESFNVVLRDGNRFAETTLGSTTLFQPETGFAAVTGVLGIFALAFLGGLILNVMPCVLPVLAIKLTSALKANDQSLARVRAGFLASAAGIVTSMLALALLLVLVRFGGGQIGWGIQFQSPLFLSLMTVIVAGFAANLLGLFEISLPQSMNTRLAGISGKDGLAGDFATGALATLLATPCSAPFLGTAVTVALTGSLPMLFGIFLVLGLGLALPYLAVAAFPSLVRFLPKPGRWMLVVKWIMGALLALTTLWLLSVIAANTAPWISGVTALFILLGVAALFLVRYRPVAGYGAVLALVAAVLVPGIATTGSPAELAEESFWEEFEHEEIAEELAEGKVIFVDVTADWCLTCKANKRLVLDRPDIQLALASEDVVAMRADWTRPDDEILTYLQMNSRFGIPFNIVYGPGAPYGIALPELLTKSAVIEALNAAK